MLANMLPARAITGLVVAGALGAAAVIGAQPADADRTDDVFIRVLDDAGITYPSEAYAIRAAHAVCDLLDQGVPLSVSIDDLSQVSYLNLEQSEFFHGAAIVSYCAWHLPTAARSL